MMGYGIYGGYGGIGGFGMIFMLILFAIIIWFVMSLFRNGSASFCNNGNGMHNDGVNNNEDLRLSKIEQQVESNRETLGKILKKLE
ncbi:hypothetical protein [Methanococcoides alaskense]|uniref:Membrane protein n=2 Tax=Methanococcoides alaskense TaxID=325778 RepID=A0AA90ZA62_9EURY|nr:hypothetical protein [Methanococcoides alaskense]MDR6223849.1 putative membrane protein [Methanococcoides alaskense]